MFRVPPAGDGDSDPPMRRLMAALLVLALPLGAHAEQKPAGATTILLVRHAEKAGPSGDVPLSTAGKARAAKLAWTLRDAGVRHIFTTELLRTRETAVPLATRLGVTPRVVLAAAIDDLVRALAALPPGAVALVVHHSNTLPPIVEKLGGARLPPVADDEYDRLLVVTRPQGGGPQVLTLRY